jgi:hypothetical protein
VDSVATEEVEAADEVASAAVIVADEAASLPEEATEAEVADEVLPGADEVRREVVREVAEVVLEALAPRVPVPSRWNPTSTLVCSLPRLVERCGVAGLG